MARPRKQAKNLGGEGQRAVTVPPPSSRGAESREERSKAADPPSPPEKPVERPQRTADGPTKASEPASPPPREVAADADEGAGGGSVPQVAADGGAHGARATKGEKARKVAVTMPTTVKERLDVARREQDRSATEVTLDAVDAVRGLAEPPWDRDSDGGGLARPQRQRDLKVVANLYLRDREREIVDDVAARWGMTRSELVREALQHHLR